MRAYLETVAFWALSLPLVAPSYRPHLLRMLGVKIGTNVWMPHGVFLGSRKLEMQDNSCVNVGSFIDGRDHVFIGEGARLGPHVRILTGTHSIQPYVMRRDPREHLSAPVRIERGCWIGLGAIIMPGVTIAEGCVIAAGSVVLHDTEANCLYAGNPAIKKRALETREMVEGRG